METTLVKENGSLVRQQHPPVIRFFAHLISIIFHPLFLTSYVTAFFLYLHPNLFAGLPEPLRFFRLVMVFFSTCFLPAFAVFLMWRLKLIDNIQLSTQKERVIPLIVSTIFYFWIMYVSMNLPENPTLFVKFLKGSFAAVCVTWFFNIFFKISMHAVGVAAVAIFFILFSFKDDQPTGLYLGAAILICGLVATARFIVSDHSSKEIYAGLLLGGLAQLVAFYL